MVTKVSASFVQQRVSGLLPSSKSKRVALAAFAFLIVGLALLAKIRSLKGRVQPSPPPASPPPNPRQQSALASYYLEGNPGGRGDFRLSPKLASNGYPRALVEVLGGEDKFKAIPELKVGEQDLQYVQEGLNPYLTISPAQMTNAIMKGPDTFGRHFLAIKYYHRATQERKVDVFLCRDPEMERWYLNDERSPEDFSKDQGKSLYFLQMLLTSKHTNYDLDCLRKDKHNHYESDCFFIIKE